MKCAACQAKDEMIAVLREQLVWARTREERQGPVAAAVAPAGPVVPEPVVVASPWIKDVNGVEWGLVDGVLDTRTNVEAAQRMLDAMVNGRPPYPVEDGQEEGKP